MQLGRVLPCLRHVGCEFGIALHHAQHVVVGHVQYGSYVPADRGEGLAVHGQAIGVRLHIVQRADESSVAGECGETVDDVDPLVVRMAFQHVGRTVFVHGEHLVAVLTPVLHEQQRAMAVLPDHSRHVFVCFVVPFDLVEGGDGVTTLVVEVEVQQVEVHVGVGGQRARVAAAGCGVARVGRIADVPHRFGRGVEGFDDDAVRIGAPPEAVVPVHFLAGHEFGETDLPGVGDLVRAAGCDIVESIAGFGVRFGRIGHFVVIVRFDAGGQQRGVAVGLSGFGVVPRLDAHQLQTLPRGVQHVFAVRADARVQYGGRAGLGVQFSSAQFTHRGVPAFAHLIQFGQEQTSVQGEHHTRTRLIGRISDDSRTAFTRTLPAGAFFGGHVLAVRAGTQQYARIGDKRLMMLAVGAEPAHPQAGHGVFRAVRAQEQRTRTVADHLCGTRGTTGETQGAGLQTGVFVNRLLIHSSHLTHHASPAVSNASTRKPKTAVFQRFPTPAPQ